MEVVDIVDTDDRVVGTKDKAAAIQNGCIVRVSFIILLNAKNELFLQQRKATKKTYPLYWSGSASGHVKSKESYLEAAERELDEELGITTKLQEIGKIFSAEDKEFATFFVGRYQGTFKLEDAEIEQAAYFTLHQLQTSETTMKMTSYLLASLPMVQQFLDS